MAASEAAVNAVIEALGCERDYSDFDLSAQVEWCNEHREPNGDLVEWTDRGCPVAVAAADAAVDADRASIQAEARAGVGDKFAEWAMKAEVEPKIDWAWFGEIVRWTGSLKHEANRLAQP
jgi:hypothetical protein